MISLRDSYFASQAPESVSSLHQVGKLENP
jgi:hypothetical protein